MIREKYILHTAGQQDKWLMASTRENGMSNGRTKINFFSYNFIFTKNIAWILTSLKEHFQITLRVFYPVNSLQEKVKRSSSSRREKLTNSQI